MNCGRRLGECALCSLPPRISLATMLATRTATLQATKRALSLAPRSQLVSARAPAAAATRLGRLTTKTPVLPVNGARSFHAACRTCQEQLVKVPSMAESITEGTLKQWLKQKGDFVEADEEVATIETDKVSRTACSHSQSPLRSAPVDGSADKPSPADRAQIDVAVNAPSAGVLTDLLAQEEDTVTVGQDLFKLDTSASKPEGGGQSPSTPVAPSPSLCTECPRNRQNSGVGTVATTTPHHPRLLAKKCHDLPRLARLTPFCTQPHPRKSLSPRRRRRKSPSRRRRSPSRSRRRRPSRNPSPSTASPTRASRHRNRSSSPSGTRPRRPNSPPRASSPAMRPRCGAVSFSF